MAPPPPRDVSPPPPAAPLQSSGRPEHRRTGHRLLSGCGTIKNFLDWEQNLILTFHHFPPPFFFLFGFLRQMTRVTTRKRTRKRRRRRRRGTSALHPLIFISLTLGVRAPSQQEVSSHYHQIYTSVPLIIFLNNHLLILFA